MSTLQPALLLTLAEQQHISRSGCGLGQARRAQWAENRTRMLFYGLPSTPWSSLTCKEGMAHAPSRLLSSRAADPHRYRGLGFCVSPARHVLRYIEPEGTKTWLSAAHAYSGGLLISRSRTSEVPDAARSRLKRSTALNLAAGRRAFALSHQKAQRLHDGSLPAHDSNKALGARGPSGTEALETPSSESIKGKIQ